MVRGRVGGPRAAISVAGLPAATVAAMTVLAWATRWVVMDSAGEDGFDAWVGRVAACGAWLAVLWLVVGFAIAVFAAARRSAGDFWDHLARRVAPASVRRAAHVAAGTVLMSGAVAATAVPAVAGSLSPPTPAASELPDLDRPFLPRTPAPTSIGSPDARPATSGLETQPSKSAPDQETSPTVTRTRMPNLPTTDGAATILARQGCSGRTDPSVSESAPAAVGTSITTEQASEPVTRQPRLPGAHPATAEDHPRPRVVTVAAGDTLWDIAGVQLGPDATVADIAAEWPRWFVANRQVIGDDPDLIYPGERLASP
jgi:resuscitation-promoting factor RpfA